MDGLNGQMSLFDFIEDPDREKKEKAKAWSAGRQFAEGYLEGIKAKKSGEETLPVREPCRRRCSVECFSKECYIRRGYIWRPEEQRGNWLRDNDGRLIIGPKQCDWVPVDGPRISATFECFAEYRTEAGGVKFEECERPGTPCEGCPVHMEFYRIANEYQAQGKPWGEAVALTVEKLNLATIPEYMPDAYRHGIEYDENADEWLPKNWRQGGEDGRTKKN